MRSTQSDWRRYFDRYKVDPVDRHSGIHCLQRVFLDQDSADERRRHSGRRLHLSLGPDQRRKHASRLQTDSTGKSHSHDLPRSVTCVDTDLVYRRIYLI